MTPIEATLAAAGIIYGFAITVFLTFLIQEIRSLRTTLVDSMMAQERRLTALETKLL